MWSLPIPSRISHHCQVLLVKLPLQTGLTFHSSASSFHGPRVFTITPRIPQANESHTFDLLHRQNGIGMIWNNTISCIGMRNCCKQKVLLIHFQRLRPCLIIIKIFYGCLIVPSDTHVDRIGTKEMCCFDLQPSCQLHKRPQDPSSGPSPSTLVNLMSQPPKIRTSWSHFTYQLYHSQLS